MKKLFLLLSLSLGSAFGNNKEEALPDDIPPVLESYKDFYLLTTGKQDKKSHNFLNIFYNWKIGNLQGKDIYHKDRDYYMGQKTRIGLNKEKINEIFEKAKICEPDALLQMGYLNFSESLAPSYKYGNFSYEMAIYFLELASQYGHPLAESRLGEMYMVGIGVEQDLKKAEYWFRRASEHGYYWSDLMLGIVLLHNKPQDFPYYSRMGINSRIFSVLNRKHTRSDVINFEEVCTLFYGKFRNSVFNKVPECNKIEQIN